MSREVFFEGLKYLIENTILDIIDLDTIINDLHQEMFGDFFRRTEVFEVIILVFFAILLVCTIHNVCKNFNIYH